MSVVTLVSGGYDSTLMSLMARDEGLVMHPLFINYGQLSADREWEACQRQHKTHGLPLPNQMDVAGFGRGVPSGITDHGMRINEDAFLPCRNLFFLVLGAAFAYRVQADAVAIGLLKAEFHLFPDQTPQFIEQAEGVIRTALSTHMQILVPLAAFTKADVLKEASQQGIHDTYSCHAGGPTPCGRCVACIEIEDAKKRS